MRLTEETVVTDMCPLPDGRPACGRPLMKPGSGRMTVKEVLRRVLLDEHAYDPGVRQSGGAGDH